MGVTAVFLDENGKLDDIKSISSPNIYAPGYKDIVEFKYPVKSQTWNTSTGKYDYTYDKPASCLIYIDGAFVYYYEKEDITTGIEYQGDYLKGIGLKIYTNPDRSKEYYELTNNTNDAMKLYLENRYYDENGNLMVPYINSELVTEDLQLGQTLISQRNIDISFKYASKKVLIYTRKIETIKKSVIRDIGCVNTATEAGIQVSLTNNSMDTIGDVGITALYFDEKGNVIRTDKTSTSNIFAPGYKDTVLLKYQVTGKEWNPLTEQYDNIYDKPASYKIYISGAYWAPYVKEYDITEYEYEDEYSKGIGVKVYENPQGTAQFYELTNNTKDEVRLNMSSRYYDANGYLMSYHNYTDIVTADSMPGNAIVYWTSGVSFDYAKRKIIISAKKCGTGEDTAINDIGLVKEKTESGIKVTITNNSTKTTGMVWLTALFFDESGKVIGSPYMGISRSYAPGDTDTILLEYPRIWNPSKSPFDYTYKVPASFLVYKHGARVR